MPSRHSLYATEGERVCELSGGARTVRRLMYYSIYAMCIAEAEAAAAVVVVALQALIYLWFTRSHIRPFVRMEEQWNSMLCIAARTAVYVRSTSLAYTILYIYILKLHWHSDNSPLLTASACCSFLSPSLSLFFLILLFLFNRPFVRSLLLLLLLLCAMKNPYIKLTTTTTVTAVTATTTTMAGFLKTWTAWNLDY